MDSLANITSQYYESAIDSYVDPCTDGNTIETTVVNYESNSLVEITGNDFEAELQLHRNGEFLRSINYKGSPTHINLPNGQEFQLLKLNKCGEISVADEFSTNIRPFGAPLELSKKTYDIIREWQTTKADDKIALERFLRQDNRLTTVEKSYLVQQFLYEGAEFPNKLLFDPKPHNIYTGPVPSGPTVNKSCRCTIIRLTHAQTINPFNNIRDNGQRRDIYGVGGSNSRVFLLLASSRNRF